MSTWHTNLFGNRPGITRDTLTRLLLLIVHERGILAIIASYSIAMGILALITPLTVQEIVNTFSFAIQPVMIATLALIMACILLFISALRVLQARAVEILVQRLYTRVAVAVTETLPKFREESFAFRYANYFTEAENLPRALVAALGDLLNIIVAGGIGMTILVVYHPYFLLFNMIVIAGFMAGVWLFGRGGLDITLKVSQLHYDTYEWIQNMARNLPHVKATASTPFLLQRTDGLTREYVMARKRRSDILTGRQYKVVAVWQALGHSSLIAFAGWLLATGQITMGQFVAAEVIVGDLLINLDVLGRRMPAIIYIFTSLEELSRLFALPQDHEPDQALVTILPSRETGVTVLGQGITFAQGENEPVPTPLSLEIMPGEKVAVLAPTNPSKTAIARILAGLYRPTTGWIRYSDVDLRDLAPDALNAARSLVLDSHLTLFNATIGENIALGRPAASYQDISWAVRFVELEDDIDSLPSGLETPVTQLDKMLSPTLILRILLARALVTRPSLLIFDGTLHALPTSMRETLLRRLCSKEEHWTAIFVTNDPAIRMHVERTIVV